MLDAELGDRVRRFRILRVGLEVGWRIEIAVQNATGRREDDARSGATGTHCFHQVQRAEDVDRRIVHRIGDTLPHIHLRGKMGDHVEFPLANELRELARGHADFVELRLLRNISPFSGREVVGDVDLIALVEEKVGDV